MARPALPPLPKLDPVFAYGFSSEATIAHAIRTRSSGTVSEREVRWQIKKVQQDCTRLQKLGYTREQIKAAATSSQPASRSSEDPVDKLARTIAIQQGDRMHGHESGPRPPGEHPGPGDVIVASPTDREKFNLPRADVVSRSEIDHRASFDMGKHVVAALRPHHQKIDQLMADRVGLVDARREMLRDARRSLRMVNRRGATIHQDADRAGIARLAALSKVRSDLERGLQENQRALRGNKKAVRREEKALHLKFNAVRLEHKEALSDLARFGESPRVFVLRRKRSADAKHDTAEYTRDRTTEGKLQSRYREAQALEVLIPAKQGLGSQAQAQAAMLGQSGKNTVNMGIEADSLHERFLQAEAELNQVRALYVEAVRDRRLAAAVSQSWVVPGQEGLQSKLLQSSGDALFGDELKEVERIGKAFAGKLGEVEAEYKKRIEYNRLHHPRDEEGHKEAAAALARLTSQLQGGIFPQRQALPEEIAEARLSGRSLPREARFELDPGDYVLGGSGRFGGKALSEVPIEHLIYIVQGKDYNSLTMEKVRKYLSSHEAATRLQAYYGHDPVDPDCQTGPISLGQAPELEERSRRVNAGKPRRRREAYASTPRRQTTEGLRELPAYRQAYAIAYAAAKRKVEASLPTARQLVTWALQPGGLRLLTQAQLIKSRKFQEAHEHADAHALQQARLSTESRLKARVVSRTSRGNRVRLAAEEEATRAYQKKYREEYLARRGKVPSLGDLTFEETPASAPGILRGMLQQAARAAREVAKRVAVDVFEKKLREGYHGTVHEQLDEEDRQRARKGQPSLGPARVNDLVDAAVHRDLTDNGPWRLRPRKAVPVDRDTAQLLRTKKAAIGAERAARRAYNKKATEIRKGSPLWTNGKTANLQVHRALAGANSPELFDVRADRLPTTPEGKLTPEGKREKRARDNWRDEAKKALKPAETAARLARAERLAQLAYDDVLRAGGSPDEALGAERKAAKSIGGANWKVPAAFFDEMGQGDEFARSRKDRGRAMRDENEEMDKDYLRKLYYRSLAAFNTGQTKDPGELFVNVAATPLRGGHKVTEADKARAWNQARAMFQHDYEPSKKFRTLEYDSAWERILGKSDKGGQTIAGLLLRIEQAKTRQDVLDLIGEFRRSFGLQLNPQLHTMEAASSHTLDDGTTLTFNDPNDPTSLNFEEMDKGLSGLTDEEEAQAEMFSHVFRWVINRAVERYNSPALVAGVEEETNVQRLVFDREIGFSAGRAARLEPKEFLDLEQEANRSGLPFPEVERLSEGGLVEDEDRINQRAYQQAREDRGVEDTGDIYFGRWFDEAAASGDIAPHEWDKSTLPSMKGNRAAGLNALYGDPSEVFAEELASDRPPKTDYPEDYGRDLARRGKS